MKKNKPKVLFFDIETAPNLSYVWGQWEQNVLHNVKEWEILSFAYKWAGTNRIKAEGRYHQKRGERDLVEKLWHLFNDADIIIAHNGDAFDIKKCNSKFVEYSFPPPSFYKTVDTLKVARRYFKFNSNKLDDLGRTLGVGRKVLHNGFDLWLGCINEDPKSWKKLLTYNKQDVALLENVYNVLRSWMTNHPNSNVISGTTHNCPVCHSDKVQRRGTYMTRVNKYQRYQCLDCGAWSHGELIKRPPESKQILR